ncbi:membrane protein [Staphylococcus petrasii]|uniref:DUF4064 domain-containing protein n=1 Tax=Staphylococcus petrasii TaxID=1276936 RepID=A0A380FVW8_9STAP|nr:DUF4064 domain-containing protein [Staphylococcus petrasii]PNZ31990.1 hypothetical protein CD137_01760 [Staphylococcus petrasii]TGE13726.1 DUF4064 domain-containing protein [Staphylococcus petrasii]TGE18120.1 DUF4064 domain-containing protein [Staphylococcus petrasii]SUM42865.1 membrane protein [Staphylococcus petrasii]
MANQTYDYSTKNGHEHNKVSRVGEHILTWVGVAIQALLAILFLLIRPFVGNSDFREQVVTETQRQGNQVSTSEINEGVGALSKFIDFLTWGSIIPLILAIIGGFLISKKHKAAGVLILIAGILALATNWISAILWIIAGIMLLVRKAKKYNDYDNHYYGNGGYDNHRGNDYNNRNNSYDNHDRNNGYANVTNQGHNRDDYNNRHDNNYDNRRNDNDDRNGYANVTNQGQRGNDYHNDRNDNRYDRDNNDRDRKDVNASNNAFILDEEDKAKEQDYIKEHYSNDDVHDGSHEHSRHSNDNDRHNRDHLYDDNGYRREDDRNYNHDTDRHEYRSSNHRDDLNRSDDDFNRRNDVDWSADKGNDDNNNIGRTLTNDEDYKRDNNRRDNDDNYRRSDRYNHNNNNDSIGLNKDLEKEQHDDNFLKDEAKKLQDKKDNDPYKY